MKIEMITDGNSKIGFGHLRRSLTLARGLKEKGHQISLKSLSPEGAPLIPEELQSSIESPTVALFDSPSDIEFLLQTYKNKSIKTLALDYFGEVQPDLTISVFEHIQPNAKSNRTHGFEYIIVREDIRKLKATTLQSEKGYVLIILGGGDLLNQAHTVAKKMSDQGLRVILVEGPFVYYEQRTEPLNYEVRKQPQDLPELMLGCDWAITNGGSSLFEMLYLGKPVHILPQTEREWVIADVALQNKGVLGIGIESLKSYSHEDIQKSKGQGSQLIDGLGVERIISRIENLADEKWLIAVTAGRWQMHGIREAQKAGLKVIGIDADVHAEGLKIVDIPLAMDLTKSDEIIAKIKSLNLNIKGAISFCSEAGMPLAGKIRDAFNLIGPRVEQTQRLIDKSLQRKIWAEKSVMGPDNWTLCSSKEDALRTIKNFALPLIIKPVDSSGSRGVAKIESLQGLDEIVAAAFSFSKTQQVLIESYMEGTEFTIEVFANKGEVTVLAMSEKKKVEGTGGVVASELSTPNRPEIELEHIRQTVIAAFKALEYQSGPGHAEAILMKDGRVGMVEVAGRGGGFMVFDGFVPTVSGINIARLSALQAVGIEIPPFEKNNYASVLRFFPSRPGIVRAINGFENIKNINGVMASSFVNVGDHVGGAAADGDRLGYILTRGDTFQEAQQLADQAETMVRFEIN